MKTKLTVSYPAPINTELDTKITETMESIGAKWYAQGCDVNTEHPERDICFDFEL